MALPIHSSPSSLDLSAGPPSSGLTVLSNANVEEQGRPHSATHDQIKTNNLVMNTAFTEFNIKDDSDEEGMKNTGPPQPPPQQKQQRKTWTPSSLSFKPFRAKSSVRNSLPSVSTRKVKKISNTTFSTFLSSVASVAATSTLRLPGTMEGTCTKDTDSRHGTPSYQLSPFAFETTIPIKTPSSSSTTTSTHSSSSSSLSCAPVNATAPISRPTPYPPPPKHQVGQLLFGTPILDDPAFFEKEFHTIINDHHHPLSILHPKQLTVEWGYTNCHRILEQYNRLLAPETQHGKKALYSSLKQQLEDMEDDIAAEHTLNRLETLVHALSHAIHQGILLTNYGRMVIPNKRYWIEGNNQCGGSSSVTPAFYNTVDHRDEKAAWYVDIFASQPYHTFAGLKDDRPVLLTTLWDGMTNKYLCILRSTAAPDLRVFIDGGNKMNDEGYQEDSTPYSIQTTTMTPEWETALEETFALDLTQLVHIDSGLMRSSGIEQDLIRLDKDTIHHHFKCGVLYIKEGQYHENDWFSNDCGSDAFDSFLECLGDKIALQGYQGWAAGLDTKSRESGDYTYTSTWQETYQVTYHISTLIPSTSGDKQHIQRKRHIGNDIVCIVFVDGHRPFDPAAITSQFLHVFIVVHLEGKSRWRVEVTCVKDVPLFGPPVTSHTFCDKSSLHDFLLAKVINAEYAALKAPKFTRPLDRARQGILTNVVERILKIHNNNNNSSSSKSGGKIHSNKGNSRNRYHVISLRPPNHGPTTLLKDLLSSDGFVGTLGRRKSAQDALAVTPVIKGSSDHQGNKARNGNLDA
ncbi:hypothetical protein [Absidia glauca]|uniref:Rap-GAP domain-containing protein n=1 Tax=Absidia glauca TaxID=4829 RepID=A0A168SQX8_ABSGL|nr:hypothetical protein [Absidia glauca]